MKRNMLLSLLMGLIYCPCWAPAQHPSHPAGAVLIPISTIRLIAAPSSFDGQRIRVFGFLGYGNGSDKALGLYVSEIDSRNLIYSNSIDLHIDDSKIRTLIGHYIGLSGVFHAPDPQSNFNGYIDQAQDIGKWPPGDEPR
jgi:hypothetical protein